MSTQLQVHAHRCEECAKAGKNVFWIHSDACAGKVAEHKCPQCGTVQWKKALIEPQRLPQPRQQKGGIDFETILGYVILLLALGMIGYVGYIYWKERSGQQKKIAP